MKKISLLILITILTACAVPVADMATAIPSSTAAQEIFPTKTLTPQPTATQTIIPNTPTLDPKERTVIVGFTKEVNAAIAEMVKDDVPTIPFHYTDGTEVPLGMTTLKEAQVRYVIAAYRGMLDMSTFDSNFSPGNATLFIFETRDVNGGTVYFSLGLGKAPASDPTQLPIVFIDGDISISGLADTEWHFERPRWYDLYNYLVKRFSAMQPGQEVVVSITEPRRVETQFDAVAKELIDALNGQDVDGISPISEISFYQPGAFWFLDDGTRP